MSECLIITGEKALKGKVKISGAKNSALPLLVASLLCSEETTISNVPDLEDITVTLRLLRELGVKALYDGEKVIIYPSDIINSEAPLSLVKLLRSSFLFLGPVVARTKKAKIPLPGGDSIGNRPVDIHLKALTELGVDLRIEGGMVIASVPGALKAKEINFSYPSVGATQHLIMTASLIKGTTVLRNVAREPEIVDLANFINKAGGDIEGAGTSEIVIRGKSRLLGANHTVLPDRIEAMTHLIAGIITKGGVCVTDVNKEVLGSSLDLLGQIGCKLDITDSSITAGYQNELKPFDLITGPWPEIATDLQPILMALAVAIPGKSTVLETVFENRFGHVPEFRSFGADIFIDDKKAIINGGMPLKATNANGIDIRAAVGVVLLALAAQGTSCIYGVHHLDRGYERLTAKLRSLNADIVRSSSHNISEIIYGC